MIYCVENEVTFDCKFYPLFCCYSTVMATKESVGCFIQEGKFDGLCGF